MKDFVHLPLRFDTQDQGNIGRGKTHVGQAQETCTLIPTNAFNPL
jgi:hypothetical protein